MPETPTSKHRRPANGDHALSAIHADGEVHVPHTLALVVGLIFLAVFIAWGFLAPYAGAVIVPGNFKVDFYRKTVQHLEGGIVSEILVRSGERVKAGQSLIRLEDVSFSSNAASLQDQLFAELAKEARLTAERDRRASVDVPAELRAAHDQKKVADLLAVETDLFNAKRRLLDGQATLLREQGKEVRTQILVLEQQVASSNNTEGLSREELGLYERLYEQRYVDYPKILGLRRAIAEKQEKRGEYAAALSSSRQHVIDIELRIGNLYDDNAKAASDELRDTRKKIFELREQLRPVLDGLKRRSIVAPIAGTVVDLKVFTAGGVIAPGQPLMDIVPDNSTLVFEGRVRPQDIEHLRLGGPAEIELSAFLRRTTPMVKGAVSYVSADTVKDPASPDKENEHYLMQVKVDPESMKTMPENVFLTAGMPATAFVQTSMRTPFEYLLKPLLDTIRRTFKE